MWSNRIHLVYEIRLQRYWDWQICVCGENSFLFLLFKKDLIFQSSELFNLPDWLIDCDPMEWPLQSESNLNIRFLIENKTMSIKTIWNVTTLSIAIKSSSYTRVSSGYHCTIKNSKFMIMENSFAGKISL